MSAIWKKTVTIEDARRRAENTTITHLGIELLEFGPDYIKGRVPVDTRTKQPEGLLHGGVSVVLAETLGTLGAYYASPEGHGAVGLDINANHLKSARSGWATGIARPVHIGRTTQVWQIEIRNDADEMICVSRITLAMLTPR